VAERSNPFQMPRPMSVRGRISSITNSFINGIIPIVAPTAQEISDALADLQMDSDNVRCIYCGDPATEWDHLRPLVKGQRATGYISEIANLVPACGKCNQSKGNKPWREWMMSAALLSPKTRGVANLAERIDLLNRYETSRTPTLVDFEKIVGTELWAQYWDNWRALLNAMQASDDLAVELRTRIRNHFNAIDSK